MLIIGFVLSEEIQCQSELLDLVPAVEEANMISMLLDKKMVFTALPVSAEARFDFILFVFFVSFSYLLHNIHTVGDFSEVTMVAK